MAFFINAEAAMFIPVMFAVQYTVWCNVMKWDLDIPYPATQQDLPVTYSSCEVLTAIFYSQILRLWFPQPDNIVTKVT